MGSIYEISAWMPSKAYKTHDIVLQDGLYYYAKQDHTSGASFDSSLWNGVVSVNGTNKPLFFWKGTYGSNIQSEPKVRVAKFGDGYEQRSAEGISNTLIVADIIFEGKTSAEATAILHFLYTRAAVESFMWTPPAPYNTQRKFVCRRWVETFNFFDNHTIRATFEEVVN
jgi:phage-related protein